MTEITYRTRASGPGWPIRDIMAVYLAQTCGNLELAFYRACADVYELSKGGALRAPPMDGPADVQIDKPKAIT